MPDKSVDRFEALLDYFAVRTRRFNRYLSTSDKNKKHKQNAVGKVGSFKFIHKYDPIIIQRLNKTRTEENFVFRFFALIMIHRYYIFLRIPLWTIAWTSTCNEKIKFKVFSQRNDFKIIE